MSIIGAMVLTMMVITPSFGENKLSQPVDVEGIKKAILENNLTVKGLDNDINLANYKYVKAVNSKGNSGQGVMDANKRMNDYYVKQAKITLDYSTWLKTDKLQSLLLQGEEIYWRTLLLNNEIALTQTKVDRIKNTKNNMQKKVDLGQEVASAVTSIDLTLQNEEGNMNGLEQKKTGYLMDLNVMMLQDMTSKLDMTIKNIPEITFDENIDEAIAKALKSDGNVVKLSQEMDLYNLEISLYTTYGTTDADKEAKVQVVHDADQKALDLQAAKLNLEYSIRSQYNTVLNDKDSVAIAQLKIDGLSLDLEAAKKRQEAGMVTDDAVNQFNEQLQFAKLNFEKAKLEYYIDILELTNMIN